MLASMTERRAKALRDRRSGPRQFDLFGESRPKAAGDMPAWSALPVETRSELIGLIARLILEHLEPKQRNPAAAGVSHDL